MKKIENIATLLPVVGNQRIVEQRGFTGSKIPDARLLSFELFLPRLTNISLLERNLSIF